MKQIYALIASVAIGGMISASAQYLNERPVKLPGEPRQLDKSIIKPLSHEALKPMHAPSRAAETAGVDVTEFTQLMYYDDQYNWFEYTPGTQESIELDTPKNVTSAEELVYEVNDGEITIDYLFGYSNEYLASNESVKDFVAPTMYWNDEGQLMLKLGKLFTYSSTSNYDYYLGTIEFTEDEEGNEDYEFVTEGEVPLTVWSNCWEFDGYLGMYVKDPETGKLLNIEVLGSNFVCFKPNAVLEYDVVHSSGVLPIENEIYTFYSPADPTDPEDYDRLYLSNVWYYNEGITVEVAILGEEAVISEQVIYPSQTDYDNQVYTGSFYWWTYDVDSEEVEDYIIPATFTDLGDEQYKLEWDVNTTPCTQAYLRYAFYMTPGSVTMNFSTNSLKSAIAEETNGPAEYYNLQGVKVANPSAGQIYIVKEGSKVRKQIIR